MYEKLNAAEKQIEASAFLEKSCASSASAASHCPFPALTLFCAIFKPQVVALISEERSGLQKSMEGVPWCARGLDSLRPSAAWAFLC